MIRRLATIVYAAVDHLVSVATSFAGVHFDQFVDHWATLARNNEELHYEIKSPPPNRLLKRFDDDRLDGSRATMTSMRGVDLEIPMRDVRSRRKSRG